MNTRLTRKGSLPSHGRLLLPDRATAQQSEVWPIPEGRVAGWIRTKNARCTRDGVREFAAPSV